MAKAVGAAADRLGDGNLDLVRFVTEFRRLCPQSSMQLEILTGRPTTILPYLEADFSMAFLKTPGWEFARFAALAKSGQRFMSTMVSRTWPASGRR